MDCANICRAAQSIINQYIKENGPGTDLMLVLQIQKIQDGTMDIRKKLTFIDNIPPTDT